MELPTTCRSSLTVTTTSTTMKGSGWRRKRRTVRRWTSRVCSATGEIAARDLLTFSLLCFYLKVPKRWIEQDIWEAVFDAPRAHFYMCRCVFQVADLCAGRPAALRGWARGQPRGRDKKAQWVDPDEEPEGRSVLFKWLNLFHFHFFPH